MPKIPFLVTACIDNSTYIGVDQSFQDSRIVLAYNESHAATLYNAYWAAQCRKYSVQYCILDLHVAETLGTYDD